jgi:hypothetical protein
MRDRGPALRRGRRAHDAVGGDEDVRLAVRRGRAAVEDADLLHQRVRPGQLAQGRAAQRWRQGQPYAHAQPRRLLQERLGVGQEVELAGRRVVDPGAAAQRAHVVVEDDVDRAGAGHGCLAATLPAGGARRASEPEPVGGCNRPRRPG